MKQRNFLLDFLKGIACICVVLIHCPFPGLVGKGLYALSRFAVPLFFAISGYYVFSEDPQKVHDRLGSKIMHIFKLFIGTECLYFIWNCIQHSIKYGSVKGAAIWIGSRFSLENFVNLLVFQKTTIGSISWFLLALLLCYLVTYPIAKYKLWNKIYCLGYFLLFLNITVGEIIPFFGIQSEWYWSSSFLTLGLPFFAIGFHLKQNESSIKNQLSDKYIILFFLLSCLCSVIEMAVTKASQLFIGNIFMAYLAFVYVLKHPDALRSVPAANVIAYVGEKLSFYVYILHIIVRSLLRELGNNIGIAESSAWEYSFPICVIVVSCLIAYLCDKIFRKKKKCSM